jgi:hypothetical protein
VAFVGCAFSGPRATERLTRTRSCPDSGDVFKSCPPQGKFPKSNASKPVTAYEPSHVVGFDFRDASFIDFALHDMPMRHQFP